MAGSWEILEKHSVFAYTLHTDVVTMKWAEYFKNLKGISRHLPLAGMPFDMARNTACMACLEGRYEWCLSIDSDVCAPPDAVLRLMSHNYPIISAVYCRRSPPHSVPVAIKNGSWVKNLPPKGLLNVDVVGAGFLLIHRTILERLKPQRPECGKHWFDWRVDCRGILPDHRCLSEDFTMCQAVKEQLGISVKLDCAIRCKHVGFFECDYNDARPLDTHAVDCL